MYIYIYTMSLLSIHFLFLLKMIRVIINLYTFSAFQCLVLHKPKKKNTDKLYVQIIITTVYNSFTVCIYF